jgi:type II secretory pathway predicted ATPase ExeA
MNCIINLKGFKEINAVDEIVKRAKTHQIVIINEAHDIAQYRVLTYRLVDRLWEQVRGSRVVLPDFNEF